MQIRHLFLLSAAVLLCACKKPETIVVPPPPEPDTTVTPDDPENPDNPDNPAPSPDGDYIIVGYATYWDTTMPDPSLLTHINYSFAHIKSDFESLDLKNESRLAKIAALKNGNPGLKVMLSVGGWEAGNFSGYTRSWDSEAMVPYLVNASGAMVLSYDDETSVGLKADYVKSKGLKGAMYWNIEADDAGWTLSKAIASRLKGESEPDASTAFLATNEYVQKYLEEVEYTDTAYETTRILDFPGGGPGTADNSVIANGSFATRGALHQVFFEPNVRNGRDLGGYKGYDGKTVVYHKLYRGGRLDGKYSNSKGREEMRAEGIRAEIDLREASDVPSKSPLGSDIAFFAPGFDSGTYQERIVKYLKQIGVPQQDIDDLRSIMLR